MKTDDMETMVNLDDTFSITIEEESDCSMDGGYSFETTFNTTYLDAQLANALIIELQLFLKGIE
jgi:hypothetical protein